MNGTRDQRLHHHVSDMPLISGLPDFSISTPALTYLKDARAQLEAMLLPPSSDFISQGLCIWLLGTRKLKAASPVTFMGVSSQGLIRDKSGYSSPSCFHFCLDHAGSNAGRSELRSRGVVIDLKPWSFLQVQVSSPMPRLRLTLSQLLVSTHCCVMLQNT